MLISLYLVLAIDVINLHVDREDEDDWKHGHKALQ